MKLEVSGTPGSWKVTVDGKEVPCDWVPLPNGHYSLILDGRVYDFLIELSDDSCSVVGRDTSHALRISDSRRLRSQHEVEEGLAGLQRLTAEMPGKVVRILVKARRYGVLRPGAPGIGSHENAERDSCAQERHGQGYRRCSRQSRQHRRVPPQPRINLNIISRRGGWAAALPADRASR